MKQILISKKGFALLTVTGLIDSFVFPHPFALLAFLFFFVLDIVTGLALARKAGDIESNIARSKTYEKVIQYVVVISMGIAASTCSSFLPEALKTYALPLKVIGDIMVWYCVAIEALSNVENGIKLSPYSPISKHLLKPIAKKLKLKVNEFDNYLNKSKNEKN